MLKVSFAEALVEFLVNDSLHSGVDFHSSVFPVDQFNPLQRVDIDAFMDKGLSVLILLTNVEPGARFKSKSQSFIVLLKIVKYFRGNASSELLLREVLFVN